MIDNIFFSYQGANQHIHCKLYNEYTNKIYVHFNQISPSFTEYYTSMLVDIIPIGATWSKTVTKNSTTYKITMEFLGSNEKNTMSKIKVSIV
jgi:hypothetical protein